MNDDFSLQQMVKQQVRTWDVLDSRVLDVMTQIPRNRFVPVPYLAVAFADYCIPLDHGRHMLTPKVIGRILQALDLQPTDKVLEFGTGSGYLAACMAALAGQVRSLDTQSDFVDRAAQIAGDLGLKNLTVEHCPEYSPVQDRRYDVVVIREPLAQYDSRFEGLLNTGGRLYLCVGEPPVRDALLVTRQDNEHCITTSLFDALTAIPYGSEQRQAFEF
ncbi:MAG: methyltransferase domain-containing protein [Gammaproteobacteria bacterium]|nr:methyltransferase domain-containing protein [Gammaproteobacteria bacterium]